MNEKGLEGYKLASKRVTNIGYKLKIELPIGGTTTELENIQENIEKAYKCKCIIENIQFSNCVNVELITHEIEDQEYRSMPMVPTRLLLGYDFRGDRITADMITTPHLLITGLSGQGKSGLLRVIIKNLFDADIVLLNGFAEDFDIFDIREINGEEDITEYLQDILDNPYVREKPLYLIIEELATIKEKKLNDIIKQLLCIARHYNIYIIGVVQQATKEEIKFKSYFNARLTFRQLEESSYRVVLGCSVSDMLQKREFYLYSDGLYKGKTYSLY